MHCIRHPVKIALLQIVFTRVVRSRLAPAKFALLRSTPRSLAPQRFASWSSGWISALSVLDKFQCTMLLVKRLKCSKFAIGQG